MITIFKRREVWKSEIRSVYTIFFIISIQFLVLLNNSNFIVCAVQQRKFTGRGIIDDNLKRNRRVRINIKILKNILLHIELRYHPMLIKKNPS